MSKEAALALMNGGTPLPTNPGLITQDMPQSPDATPAPPKQDLDSDRFARLAAREAKLQADREALKTDQQKAYEEKAKLKEVQDKLQAYYDLKKTDPIAALKSLDFSDEDIFNAFSNAADKKEPTAEEKAAALVDEKFKSYEQKQLDAQAKLQADRDAKNIQMFKDGIGKAIEADAEKYEYSNFYGPIAQELVYETVLEIMKVEKDIAPHDAMKEAMDLVEELYEKEEVEMSKLKKRSKLLAQPAVVEPTPVPTKESQKPKGIPTLNNKATASVASQVKSAGESRSAKRERLINQIKTSGLKAK